MILLYVVNSYLTHRRLDLYKLQYESQSLLMFYYYYYFIFVVYGIKNVDSMSVDYMRIQENHTSGSNVFKFSIDKQRDRSPLEFRSIENMNIQTQALPTHFNQS